MKINLLSAIQVEKAARKGVKVALHDGAGLYLMIRPPGGASWFLRYTGAGKQRWHGLGAFPAVSLADARQRAVEARRTLAVEGVDPIAAKAGARTAALLEAAKSMTFGQCAAQYVASHEAGWRQGGKSAKQWTASLAVYVYPVIGALPVAAIDTALVMRILEPIWNAKTETASRVRSRIESILDYARVRGWRNGENPARWRGHLEALLPPPAKLKSGAHHAAMDYRALPEFMAKLRTDDSVAARALEFTILTAARAGETRGAAWSEIDLAAMLWIIPASRMKAHKEHRVPLSDRALAVLQLVQPQGTAEGLVFRSKSGKPLHNTAFAKCPALLGQDVTVHGFRSAFRDWCAEQTNVPSEIAEAALAHQTGSAVERAYARSDLLDRRRALMDQWSTYCTAPKVEAANVVPIRAAV